MGWGIPNFNQVNVCALNFFARKYATVICSRPEVNTAYGGFLTRTLYLYSDI